MPTSPSAARTAVSTLTVDEAQGRILARIAPLEPTEVGLLDALGAVLAEDATADRDVPPFRNSAMDGYAVRGADVGRAGVTLHVVGSVAAGALPGRTGGAREAMRIMTGADRKSVGEGKSVDLGGRRIIKKKKSLTARR